jgi:multidrug efflux pump subunit AcrB
MAGGDLIMVMGIATKNSILLVGHIFIVRQKHGLGHTAATFDACRKRPWPIVMNTIAMVAGMLPVVLGWGCAPSFCAPMAVVVISELITSTFLSPLIIPVIYASG